jgi:hypothetical protein
MVLLLFRFCCWYCCTTVLVEVAGPSFLVEKSSAAIFTPLFIVRVISWQDEAAIVGAIF